MALLSSSNVKGSCQCTAPSFTSYFIYTFPNYSFTINSIFNFPNLNEDRFSILWTVHTRRCTIYRWCVLNRPFPSSFEPHFEGEAKCNSYANKNFLMKSFALSLAFIMRFTATRKWPILLPLEIRFLYRSCSFRQIKSKYGLIVSQSFVPVISKFKQSGWTTTKANWLNKHNLNFMLNSVLHKRTIYCYIWAWCWCHIYIKFCCCCCCFVCFSFHIAGWLSY